MYCNCGGGEMTDHKVQKDLGVIQKYKKCSGCGRIETYWRLESEEMSEMRSADFVQEK